MTVPDPIEPVDTVDLSEEREPDRVVIEENPEGRRPYIATPYRDSGDGYDELGPEFKVNNEYIAEVESKTDVDGDIAFLRDWAMPIEEDDVI